MSRQFLFPHKIKFVGIALFVLGIISIIFIDDDAKWLSIKNFPVIFGDGGNGEWSFFQSQNVNLAYTIKSVLLIVGSLLIAFSKEKTEDEFINSLRLRSFQYAVLINFTIVLLCFLFIWGWNFTAVLVYNMYSTLIFFILIFHILLWKNSKKEVGK